jgi:propanediol dehydratase large subunit
LPSEHSDRFGSRAGKELRRELIISPMPELGLVAANGPDDPEPELIVVDGVVQRMD